MPAHLPASAVIGLVFLCSLWGVGQVAIKIGNIGISPIMQAGLRSLIAAGCLFVWCTVRGIPLFERDGTLRAGLLAGALFALEFLLLFLALQYTSAARGTLFLNTSPFIVALGAHFFLKHDALTSTKLIGLTAAFAGVVLAFSDSLSMPSPQALTGDVMCLLAAVAWGATTVVIKGSTLATATPEKTLMYQLALSAVVLMVASPLTGEAGVFAADTTVWLAVAYHSVVIAFASYVAWFSLLRRYPASRVSVFVFLTPVFGVIAGGVLLNEPISQKLVLALALIAAGIYLVNRPSTSSEQ